MMTLGTTGAFGFEDFHPPEVLGLYAAAGCRVVQVYRNRLRHITARDVRALMPDQPLTIDSIHGVFGDDIDPSSEDEQHRRRSVEIYHGEAEFCRELGGDLVVVHPCPARTPFGSLDAKYAQLRRSLDELQRMGERHGVRFAVENMPPYHPVGNDAPRLAGLVQAAALSRIVFLLDTGHAHMTGGIGPAIRGAGATIGYTHVHDNDGAVDTHILPTRGTLPWDELESGLHAVGYRGIFLLEVFEKADDLRRLLNDGWKARMQRILAGPRQASQ